MKEDWQRQDQETAIWISLAIALICAASAAIILGVNGWVPILIAIVTIVVFFAVLGCMLLIFRRFIFPQDKSKSNLNKKTKPLWVAITPWLFPRQAKFWKCREMIQKIEDQLYKVKDSDIQLENRLAMIAVSDLVDSFESKEDPQGRTEEKLPVLLQNISKVIAAWIDYESRRLPLKIDEARSLYNTLLNTKDLAWVYQENGLDMVNRYLASLLELQNDMQSSGINPDKV